jgi:hypothetical protein
MGVSKRQLLVLTLACLAITGCLSSGNSGSIQSYSFMAVEPKWIREGEPIFFDGKRWYPQDDIEMMQDNEVFLLGEYRGLQIFVAKTDVKPYERLYTKFDVNKYR